MTTTAIYARVSTPGQEEQGTSLETQVASCQEHARQQGLETPETLVFREQASGADQDRPILAKVLSMALSGEFQALTVHAPDRLSRNPCT